MRSKSAEIKADIQSGKNINVVEEFMLKLPGKNSHQYHMIDGEVRSIMCLFMGLLYDTR